MTDIDAHPTTNRLSAYIQGRLDEPEMDEIEQHLSSCDSCCRWIREQPEDSLVAKLRGRGAATVAEDEVRGRADVGPPGPLILRPRRRSQGHCPSRLNRPSRASPGISTTIRATGSWPPSAAGAWGRSTAPSIA